MKKKPIIMTITLVMTLCCIIPLAVFIIPDQIFNAREVEAVPQFDALNAAVLAEMPPPDHAPIIHQSSIGIIAPTAVHGRLLSVDYDLKNMKIEEVLAYYDALLKKNGWIAKSQHRDNAFYYRKSACVTIEFHNMKYPDKYFHIRIWHDYFSQSFSPPIPWWFGWKDGDRSSSLYSNFFELGMSEIYQCP